MTDRVERALRGLREQESGAHPHAEETLQRVLAERRMAKRSWRRSARLWIPIAAVLACSTAALAWMETFGAKPAPLSAADEAAKLHRGVVPPGPSTGIALPPPAPSVTSTSEQVAVEEKEPLPAPAPLPPRPVPSHRVSPAASASAMTSAVAASDAPPSSPTAGNESSEADVYARAHRLHFDGDNAPGALSAWDDYLLRFPDGRFAPDARYNRAIDLLKLRRYAEARAALQPFADGAFGGYHRDDARELLRSMP
jgi:hypothetical protein